MNIKSLFKRYPLWAYLIITYVFSWALWSVLAVTFPPNVMQEGMPPTFIILAMLGNIGPSLAGIVTTSIVDGKEGLRDLFARFRRWRVGIGWYAAALLITPLVGLATLAVEGALGMPTATLEEMIGTLPISIIWPLLAALGEEFGWRGFYLPRLQKRHTALRASIVVGVVWGLWHIPTQVLAFRQYGLLVVSANVFATHIVAVTAQTTVMTWVHNNARQSLLLMILSHFGITFTAGFLFPLSMSVIEGLRHWLIYAVFYWLAALVVIAIAGPKRLVRESRSLQQA
jgi:membrane protease YdiL (CAAX protease family)